MANINEILARAAALRNETALNSIDPERAGGIMYDTLIALNELWLQQGAALVISKIYASVAAMNADTSPVSDLTGRPIRPGMVVVIASSDSDNGSVYRYNGPDSPSWSLVGKIGNLEPVDSLDSDSTQLPLAARQGKVLDEKISQLGQYEDRDDYLYAMIDKEGKLLFAVKQDGDIVFGVGIPSEIKIAISQVQFNLDNFLLAIKEVCRFEENEDYLNVVIDAEGKLVEAITKMGRKIIFGGLDVHGETDLDGEKHYRIPNEDYLKVEVDGEGKIVEATTNKGKKIFFGGAELKDNADILSAKIYEFPNETYMEAKTDEAGRLIEGVTKDGKKHISDFDEATKNTIRSFARGSTLFEIPELNDIFISPLPVDIEGTKGDENAKYTFSLPLEESWVIRFKFRITENILNQVKHSVIASINGATVTASVLPLSQRIETGTSDGVTYNDKWPTLDGGIKFNGNTLNPYWEKRHIGGQAFSVQYVGSGTSASIENDGTGIILTIDGTATRYDFSTYTKVSELFEAMKSNADIALQYIALDQRNCVELAKFSEISLKSIVHTGIGGEEFTPIVAHEVAAPFYLRYAVSDEWYQAEILKIGDTIYSVCDGVVKSVTTASAANKLVLGGSCGVLFKDLVISTNNTLDTEIVSGKVVSSVNPSTIIFEIHGMTDKPMYEITPEETQAGMNGLNPDTMEFFFSVLEKKGYVPVSIEEIADFYMYRRPLPKRCYTFTFDDRRWPICMDNNLRRVFKRHGAKPALAMITTAPPGESIMYNGEVITQEKASAICKAAGFSLVTHTKLHTYNTTLSPEEYLSFYTQDLYSADVLGVNGAVLVYPGGRNNVYLHDVLEFLGYAIGIEIYNYSHINNLIHNRFNLSRVNIGRVITADGTLLEPYTDYINKLI